VAPALPSAEDLSSVFSAVRADGIKNGTACDGSDQRSAAKSSKSDIPYLLFELQLERSGYPRPPRTFAQLPSKPTIQFFDFGQWLWTNCRLRSRDQSTDRGQLQKFAPKKLKQMRASRTGMGVWVTSAGSRSRPGPDQCRRPTLDFESWLALRERGTNAISKDRIFYHEIIEFLRRGIFRSLRSPRPPSRR